jgi:hypothetical protein
MIFSENRCTLFRIMRYGHTPDMMALYPLQPCWRSTPVSGRPLAPMLGSLPW